MLSRSCIALTLLSIEPLRLFDLSDVDVVRKRGGVLSFHPALIDSPISSPLTLAAEVVGGARLP